MVSVFVYIDGGKTLRIARFIHGPALGFGCLSYAGFAHTEVDGGLSEGEVTWDCCHFACDFTSLFCCLG